MEFDPERVWANVRKATTEDLLDRVTAYRAGMEPEALTIIEAELRRRGVDDAQIHAHGEQREGQSIPLPDGTAAMCSFCHRPAVARAWGWRQLPGRWRWLPPWGLPLLPRWYSYCEEHRPAKRV
jgi:hypothetical protein